MQVNQRQHILGRLVYSQSPAARWLRWGVVALAIAVGLAALKLPLESLLPEHAFRKDFLQEYLLVKAIADGVDPYLPTAVLAERYLGALPRAVFPHPTPHPPPVGLLLLPLALFNYSTAAAVWFGLELVCLLVSVCVLGRALETRLSTWATLGIAAALLAWYPFSFELAFGQLMIPMLAVLSGAWLALRTGRSALGGALVGLAILLKPVPWPLLLLFVLRRDWRALAGAVSVLAGGYLAAGCVVGLGTLEYYFSTVLPLVSRSYRADPWSFSVWSLGWRVFDGTGSKVIIGLEAPPLVRSALAAQVVSVALPCLVLLAACLAVRRQRTLDVSFGVMISVSILTAPISWSHYLVLAVIPAAYVIRWLGRHELPLRETNWALVVAMLLFLDWGRLVHLAAGARGALDETRTISFGLAMFTQVPALAVGALAWLLVWLGPVDNGVDAKRAWLKDVVSRLG